MKIKFLCILFLTFGATAQNITIDDTYTAQNLVQNVLFNNTNCATISNIVISGGNFGTPDNSYAYFNGNSSVFPFAEGIVLSTGKAINTAGPNNNLSDDDATNWNLDADLETVLGTSNTLNATILEFDFIPKSSFFSFEYIFASEEYQENDANTCVYSDVFAFLLKPIGGTYTNIAVVPNTNIPVSVTSVHAFVNASCPAENETYFGSWNDSTAPINFNGQTTVLTAKSVVIPNQAYHIKLVIADHQNYRYDSAVFLNANSFNIGIDLGNDRLINTGNALCDNDTLTLDSEILNTDWYKYNQTTTNFDFLANGQTFTINPTLGNGIYKASSNLGFGCISEGEITVEYDSFLVTNTDLVNCYSGNPQFAVFDLNHAFSLINNGDDTLIIENFYHNQPDAEASINEITNATNYNYLGQNEIVIAKIKSLSGCINYAEITLKIFQNPEIKTAEIIYYCLNNFPSKISLESGFINGTVLDYTYLWYKNDNLISDTSSSIEINSIGSYNVIIQDVNGCTATRTITVLPTEEAVFKQVLVTENEFNKNASLLVEIIGLGNYKYALDLESFQINDASYYQNTNIFENVTYNKHTLYIMDVNIFACNTIIKQIYLLKYPKFFTPNNDGYFDYWNINNINTQTTQINTISNITIYDRFGKIMAIINPKGLGWDGNYLGEETPTANYWFTVDLIDFNENIYTKKGNFSLKRKK